MNWTDTMLCYFNQLFAGILFQYLIVASIYQKILFSLRGKANGTFGLQTSLENNF